MYLAGEWWSSNLLFGAVFFVALLGVTAIGWYVLHGDRINRAGMDGADDTDVQGEHTH